MKNSWSRLIAIFIASVVVFSSVTVSSTAAAAPKLNMTAMSPSWLSSKSDITVTFMVDTKSTLPNSTVDISQSNSPLVGRSEIDAALAADSNFANQKIASISIGTVSEGKSSHTITIPRTSLSLGKAGVYVLSLTLKNQPQVAQQSILLPYFPNTSNFKKLQLVTLLPISAAPSVSARNEILNDKAANQFGTDGSLYGLVTAANNRSKITWMVDPDVIETAQIVANGGSVLRPESHEVSSEQSSAARSWLNNVQANARLATVFSIPFASADINTLINRNFKRLSSIAINSKSKLAEVIQRPFLLDAVSASRGDLDSKTWNWLSDQSIELIVVGSDRYPSTSSAYTSTGITNVGSQKVLVRDVEASSAMTSALIDDAGNIRDHQTFISQLLITALEAPSLDRVLVVQPRTNRAGISVQSASKTFDSLELPWVRAVTVEEAKQNEISQNRVALTTPIKSVTNVATNRDMNRIRKKLSDLHRILRGSSQQIAMEHTQMRIASDNFEILNDRASLRKIAVEQIGLIENSVKIMSAGSVIFPRETSVVPITIRNDLDIPVTVRIRAIGEPAVRVTATEVDAITIQPGKRKSIEIPTRLVGSDSASLILRLTDINGKQFGDFVRIELASSAYSTAAAWAVGLAFGLLLVLVVINTVRRIRVRRVEKLHSTENMSDD